MQALFEIVVEVLGWLLWELIESRGRTNVRVPPEESPEPEPLGAPRGDPWNDPRRAEEPAPRPLLDEQRLRR